jgi:hypothetical protein
MRHLGAKRPLENGLLEFPHHRFDRFGRHRASHQLVKQRRRDFRQGGVNCSFVLFLAWYSSSFYLLT